MRRQPWLRGSRMVGWVPSDRTPTVGLGEENPGNAERGSLEGPAESHTLARVGRILAPFPIEEPVRGFPGRSFRFSAAVSGPALLSAALRSGASGCACRTGRGKLRPPWAQPAASCLCAPALLTGRSGPLGRPLSPVHLRFTPAKLVASPLCPEPLLRSPGQCVWCSFVVTTNAHICLCVLCQSGFPAWGCVHTQGGTGRVVVGAGGLHLQAGVGLAVWRQGSFSGTCLCSSDLHLIGRGRPCHYGPRI